MSELKFIISSSVAWLLLKSQSKWETHQYKVLYAVQYLYLSMLNYANEHRYDQKKTIQHTYRIFEIFWIIYFSEALIWFVNQDDILRRI